MEIDGLKLGRPNWKVDVKCTTIIGAPLFALSLDTSGAPKAKGVDDARRYTPDAVLLRDVSKVVFDGKPTESMPVPVIENRNFTVKGNDDTLTDFKFPISDKDRKTLDKERKSLKVKLGDIYKEPRDVIEMRRPVTNGRLQILMQRGDAYVPKSLAEFRAITKNDWSLAILAAKKIKHRKISLYKINPARPATRRANPKLPRIKEFLKVSFRLISDDYENAFKKHVTKVGDTYTLKNTPDLKADLQRIFASTGHGAPVLNPKDGDRENSVIISPNREVGKKRKSCAITQQKANIYYIHPATPRPAAILMLLAYLNPE